MATACDVPCQQLSFHHLNCQSFTRGSFKEKAGRAAFFIIIIIFWHFKRLQEFGYSLGEQNIKMETKKIPQIFYILQKSIHACTWATSESNASYSLPWKL